MTDYRVIGEYLISEKIKEDYLTTVYRGIHAPEGKFEKFVFIIQLNKDVPGSAELKKGITSNVKNVSKLAGASLAKTFDIIAEEDETYFVSEFEDGRFLNDVINKSNEEAFPFSIDHSLLIANKLTAALSYSYSKGIKHGFVTPKSINISFEGDLKLYDFAIAPFVANISSQNSSLVKEHQSFVHPDVFRTGKPSEQYDIFSVAAITFFLLTGKPFIENGKLPDTESKMNSAVLATSSFGDDPIPDDIKKILSKAMDTENGYKTIKEFNDDLENLIFSGDYSPTTFNLAFFMHSLYRDESEQSAKLLELEKTANYAGYFLSSEGYSGEVQKKTPVALIAVLVAIVVAASIGGFWLMKNKKAAEQEKLRAQQAVQEEIKKSEQLRAQKEQEFEKMKAEMEDKLAKIMEEAEKEADEKAKQYLLEQAKIAKLQQEEELRKHEEELKKIQQEKEKKKAMIEKIQQEKESEKIKQEEEARKKEEELAKKQKEEEMAKLEEQKRLEEERKALYGQEMSLQMVDVEPNLVYQEPLKMNPSWKLKGNVLLSLLIDENGNVANVKVLKGFPKSSVHGRRAEIRIVDTIKKYKFTPATKQGVNVKVWITLTVPVS